MKKLFMLLVALCLTGVVKAQFSSSSDVFFYIPAGKSVDSDSGGCPFFMFTNGNCYYRSENSGVVRRKYKDDPSLISYFKNKSGEMRSEYNGVYKLTYDSSNSTSQRTTYYKYTPGSQYWGSEQYMYFSFSKDRKSLIEWYSNNNVRVYYTLINLKDLAPKAQNKDFLYE